MKSLQKLLNTLTIWRRTQARLKRQTEHLDNHPKMLTVCWQFFEINQFVCDLFLELTLTCPIVKQTLLRQLHLLGYYQFCSYLQSQPKDPKVFRCSFGTSYLRISSHINMKITTSIITATMGTKKYCTFLFYIHLNRGTSLDFKIDGYRKTIHPLIKRGPND